jgi:hypothetical protein
MPTLQAQTPAVARANMEIRRMSAAKTNNFNSLCSSSVLGLSKVAQKP